MNNRQTSRVKKNHACSSYCSLLETRTNHQQACTVTLNFFHETAKVVIQMRVVFVVFHVQLSSEHAWNKEWQKLL